MDINISASTLVYCQCALQSHIKSLKSILASASTLEFRSLCEEELERYTTALVEIINSQLKNYPYE